MKRSVSPDFEHDLGVTMDVLLLAFGHVTVALDNLTPRNVRVLECALVDVVNAAEAAREVLSADRAAALCVRDGWGQ